MIGFRNGPPHRPFAWRSAAQPSGRWHASGGGPAIYLATTPDAAWAEFLRHEAITDEVDLAGVERWLWAVDVPEERLTIGVPILDLDVMQGGDESYGPCQAEASSLRASGHDALRAPSAAVTRSPSGFRADAGPVPGPERDEETLVLFGRHPDLVGWIAAGPGRPDASLLARVRHLRAATNS